MKQNQSQIHRNQKYKIQSQQQYDTFLDTKLKNMKGISKQIKNKKVEEDEWQLVEIQRSIPDIAQIKQTLDFGVQKQVKPFNKKVSQYQQLDIEELSLTSDIEVSKLEIKQKQQQQLKNIKYIEDIEKKARTFTFQQKQKQKQNKQKNYDNKNVKQQNKGLFINQIQTEQIQLKANYKIESFMQFHPGQISKHARIKKQEHNRNYNYNPQNHLLQVFQEHKKLSKIKQSLSIVNKQKIVAEASYQNKKIAKNKDKEKSPQQNKIKHLQNPLKSNKIKISSPSKSFKQSNRNKDKQIFTITFYLNDEIVSQSFVKKMTFFRNQYLQDYDVFYDKQMKMKVKQKIIYISKNIDFFCQPKYQLVTNFSKTSSEFYRYNTNIDKNNYDLHFNDYRRTLSNDFQVTTKTQLKNDLAQIQEQVQPKKLVSKLTKHKSTKYFHEKQKHSQQKIRNENKIFNIKKKPKIFIEQVPTDIYNNQFEYQKYKQSQKLQQQQQQQQQNKSKKQTVISTLQTFTETVGDLRKSFYRSRDNLNSNKQYQNTYSLKKLSKPDKIIKQCHNYEQMIQLKNYLHRSRVKA